MALAPRDGAIRALVGGYSFEASPFNRAADAHRQPGSAFKPFIYAAALERGWTPASLILDAPISVRVSARDVWTPANFDHRALGPIRLRQALAQSRNLASIDLLDRVGIDYVRTFATRFGFQRAQLPAGLTLALGTGPVTLTAVGRGLCGLRQWGLSRWALSDRPDRGQRGENRLPGRPAAGLR